MNESRPARWILAAAVAALAVVPMIVADEGEEPPLPNRPYAREAREWRNYAKHIRENTAQFIAEHAWLDDFSRDDWPKLKEAAETQAALCEKVAQAFERGDERSTPSLRREAEKAGGAVHIWRHRIEEIRRRQAEATPREAGAVTDFQWMRRGTLNEYWALVRARRAAAEAWRDLAEATVPGADRALINELWEKGHAAEIHREIAEWRYHWAQRKSEIWEDQRVDSDELRAKFAAFEKVLEERIGLRLADIERDRRMRQIEREWREADEQCQKAYDRAREARERAASRRR